MAKELSRVLALVVAIAAGAPARPVLFSTGEWEPFTSARLANKGCATELVAAACKAAGIQPEFQFYPWPRAEGMVASGEAFCAFPYAMNEERRSAYDFSDVLFFTAPRFIYYARARSFGSLHPAALEELAPHSVTLLAGTWTEKDLRTAGLEVHLVNSLDSAVRMLQAGRVDFLVEDRAVAYDAIDRAFPGEAASFRTLPTAFWGATGNRLLVSRTYPEASALLERFNKGLKEIKRNGTYRRITAKYRMGGGQSPGFKASASPAGSPPRRWSAPRTARP